MDFSLTSEQKLLKETVARFVDQRVTPLAPQIDEEAQFPEKSFRAMADMGLFGISIPEVHGGSGSDLIDAHH